MMVKICGITNIEDARAAADGGAAALGFNFYSRSPRYIAPEAAEPILATVPTSVWKVGLFVNAPAGEIAAVAARLPLDVVQIHGEGALPEGVRVWKAVRVGPGFNLGELEGFAAEAFLLDTAAPGLQGGTGRTFDWKLARGAKQNVILAGGLDDTNVRQAIAEANPWGVDACSRLESAPGRKDHAKMARFLRAALS